MAAPTLTRVDSTSSIVRIVAVHVAAVAVLAAVPLVVIALVVFGSVLMVLPALVIAVLIGVAVTAARLRDVDERVASVLGAQPSEPGRHPRLDTIVESVSMAAGIEVPVMHLIESPAVNAITWGFGDGPSHMAVTTGLLSTLDRVELEAVMAHQATAVNDRPVDAVTVGAVLFGRFAAGGLAARAAELVNGSTDPRAVVLSDIEGVTATRYPPGMTSALEKVASASTIVDSIPVAFTALCFAPPVSDPGPFGVHPPIVDRIDLMREW